MNKKGLIGTGMAWIPATFLVLIILVFFIVAINVIFLGASNEISVVNVDNGFSFSKTLPIVSFLENNLEEVSNWADDGVVLTHQEWIIEKKRDPNMEALCDSFVLYRNTVDLDISKLYFISNDERIILEYVNDQTNYCRTVPPNQVIIGFDQTSIVDSHFTFLSEKGNKVEVIYAFNY